MIMTEFMKKLNINGLTPVAILVMGLLCRTSLIAANISEMYWYTSTVSSDAGGFMDLSAELNYDDSRTNAPIAVVMHQYSGTESLISGVRPSALLLRDKGFFAISVAMRGREGSDGLRDSGGLEIYDIYDAVESVKRDFPAYINTNIIYVTGYSGGGGNTMSALTKFPDYFNAGAAFFGMSDYGYDSTNGWYFNGANSGGLRTPQLDTDIGDPTPPTAAVIDRYHARASNLASINNPYSEIHLFVNADEPICPTVNDTSFYSNAVAAAEFAGEFTNINVHIGASGLYQDFNGDGTNDPNEQQYWPHHQPTADQQTSGELWFIDRLLAGEIPRKPLNSSDSLFVAGFVKTYEFECRVGDGQEGAAQLDYSLSSTNKIFDITLPGLNTQLTSRLIINTTAFDNREVSIILNGSFQGRFVGGEEWTINELSAGDHLELQESIPAVVWWENTSVSSITLTNASATSTLTGTNAAAWCYYGTNYPGQQLTGWDQSISMGNTEIGVVDVVLTNLTPSASYTMSFYATNAITGRSMWSQAVTFTAASPEPQAIPIHIDFNDNDDGPGLTQSGYIGLTSSGGTIESGYGVDGTITVTLLAPDDRDRGALSGGPGLEQSDLLRDFIFRGDGSGALVTFSTLKAGTYTFTGFFHDNTVQQESGTLGVDVGDGNGEVTKVSSFEYSTGTSPATIGTAELSFVADGVNDVVIYLRDTNAVPTAPYVINGFDLQAVPPVPANVIASIVVSNSPNSSDYILHNDGSMAVGKLMYADRTYKYAALPDYLIGADYIETANDDKTDPDLTISVTTLRPAKIYIMIDNRVGDDDSSTQPTLGDKMLWVPDLGFSDIGDDVTDDAGGIYSVYILDGVQSGTYVFREQNDGGTRSMYTIAATRFLNSGTVFYIF